MNTFKNDMKSATASFKIISDYLFKVFDTLKDIESFENEKGLKGELDKESGIDVLLKFNKGNAFLASRIQWCNNWRTFTIRYKRDTGAKTEYEKRLFEIDNNLLYPNFTIQTYLDDRDNPKKALGFCIVETKYLYQYTRENIENVLIRESKTKNKYNKESIQKFIVINFKDLENRIEYDGNTIKYYGTMKRFK